MAEKKIEIGFSVILTIATVNIFWKKFCLLLTDVTDGLLVTYPVEIYHIVGKSRDCGGKLRYLSAQIKYEFRDVQVGVSLKPATGKTLA